jgi:hypothetical protein
MRVQSMRNVLLVAAVLVAGCSEPRSPGAKPAASASQSWIGRAVIVKPNKKSQTPGMIMVFTPDHKTSWFAPMDVEAFRAVVLDELPEEYVDGKLEDSARWVVKVEDGPAEGKTVGVYKYKVDLIPVK